MKVRMLIDLLENCDPEDIVVMSKDAEGNSYSPLYDISEDRYHAETTWYGEIGLRFLTDEDIERGFTSEDVMVDGEDCVTLWPTN